MAECSIVTNGAVPMTCIPMLTSGLSLCASTAQKLFWTFQWKKLLENIWEPKKQTTKANLAQLDMANAFHFGASKVLKQDWLMYNLTIPDLHNNYLNYWAKSARRIDLFGHSHKLLRISQISCLPLRRPKQIGCTRAVEVAKTACLTNISLHSCGHEKNFSNKTIAEGQPNAQSTCHSTLLNQKNTMKLLKTKPNHNTNLYTQRLLVLHKHPTASNQLLTFCLPPAFASGEGEGETFIFGGCSDLPWRRSVSFSVCFS